MERILVKWCDGRSKGTTSFIKRSAVKDGTISVVERVMVAWGKMKRSYNAKVVNVNSSMERSEEPSAAARNEEPSTASRRNKSSAATRHKEKEKEVPFTFELLAPAQRQTPQSTPRQDSLCALLERLNDLKDTISGEEARLIARFHSLEVKVTQLQQ